MFKLPVKLQLKLYKMKNFILLIVFALAFANNCKKDPPVPSDFTVTAFDAVPVAKTNNMQLFAHYMPWFENKQTSANGNWGWHWTMNNQNPDIVDNEGKRQIAAHYYPLIGPYASSDPDLIEYHLLLMKYSGIDGVLIDWYGSTNVYDYGTNRRNTEALVEKLDKVGLKFAIVYEDATIPQVMSNTGSGEAVVLARNDMYYIQQHYFNKSSYIKIGGKPLLLVFGPSYFQAANDWQLIISAFTDKPVFMPLWGNSSKLGTTAGGEYMWVDQVNIDTKYATKDNFTNFIGGAWPGFHDFYKEGGAGENLFVIEHNNGAVWDNTLAKAQANNMSFLQLITWNDFGEGTMIEPTKEFGYLFLEKLQAFSGVSYQKSSLEAIEKQYTLRKSKSSDKSAMKMLDQAFYYWVSLQNEKAIELIDSVENR